MMKLKDLEVGDKVEVRTYDRGLVRGVVDELEVKGKNGKDTVGYVDSTGEGWWCYADQVERKV